MLNNIQLISGILQFVRLLVTTGLMLKYVENTRSQMTDQELYCHKDLRLCRIPDYNLLHITYYI